jgi:hypothetical protein
MFVPLLSVCSTRGIPIHFLYHFVSLQKYFSLIWNKISQNVAHENHLFLITEKFIKQATRTFILVDTAQWLNKME